MDHLIRLENKIDKLDTKLSRVDVTLAAQHVSLKDHIRRTELLEEDMKPVKAHVTKVKGALALLGAVTAVAGIAAVVIKVIEFIMNLAGG